MSTDDQKSISIMANRTFAIYRPVETYFNIYIQDMEGIPHDKIFVIRDLFMRNLDHLLYWEIGYGPYMFDSDFIVKIKRSLIYAFNLYISDMELIVDSINKNGNIRIHFEKNGDNNV